MYPHLPCRALQIHVHRKWRDTSQFFTFAPAWEWFLPLFAHALLTCWGVDTNVKDCPSACEGKGACPLLAPYPLRIEVDEVLRSESELSYLPASESPSLFFG
ncbi:MAG: hypothetical protein ACFFBD_28295 [Candidatus Hodarchaeota archaeon]